MRSSPVVLLQLDSEICHGLSASLERAFGGVHKAYSVEETRRAIAHHRAGYAIVDIEVASFSEVAEITRDFPATAVICIHRLADEQLWAEALNAGAFDIFSPVDTDGIVGALSRSSATMGAIAA